MREGWTKKINGCVHTLEAFGFVVNDVTVDDQNATYDIHSQAVPSCRHIMATSPEAEPGFVLWTVQRTYVSQLEERVIDSEKVPS